MDGLLNPGNNLLNYIQEIAFELTGIDVYHINADKKGHLVHDLVIEFSVFSQDQRVFAAVMFMVYDPVLDSSEFCQEIQVFVEYLEWFLSIFNIALYYRWNLIFK